MNLETATKIMGEAADKHCTTLDSKHFAAQSDLTRYLNGWTYSQLRTYAAELVRVVDDYLLMCDLEITANGGTAPGYTPTDSVSGDGSNGSI